MDPRHDQSDLCLSCIFAQIWTRNLHGSPSDGVITNLLSVERSMFGRNEDNFTDDKGDSVTQICDATKYYIGQWIQFWLKLHHRLRSQMLARCTLEVLHFGSRDRLEESITRGKKTYWDRKQTTPCVTWLKLPSLAQWLPTQHGVYLYL